MLSEHAGETLSMEHAFAPMAELQRFQPDNHLRPVIAAKPFTTHSTTALLARPPAGPVTAIEDATGAQTPVNAKDQPQKVGLGDGEGYAFSFPAGDAVASNCRRQAHPLLIADYDPTGVERLKAVLAIAQTPKDGPSYRRISADVGYLRMPTMGTEYTAQYDALAKQLLDAERWQRKGHHRRSAPGNKAAASYYVATGAHAGSPLMRISSAEERRQSCSPKRVTKDSVSSPRRYIGRPTSVLAL